MNVDKIYLQSLCILFYTIKKLVADSNATAFFECSCDLPLGLCCYKLYMHITTTKH